MALAGNFRRKPAVETETGDRGTERTSMSCKRIQRTIFLWVDRDREERLRAPLEHHLEGCPHCRERAVRVERIVVLLRQRCVRRAAPDALQQKIRALLGFE